MSFQGKSHQIQGQTNDRDYKLSNLIETGFVLASTAAIPIPGGPSAIDQEMRDTISQQIGSFEHQRYESGSEQNNHV
ncbi:MAG: hypothetical protein R2932_48490 [Caldilineaceae bacterium]